MPYKTLLTHVPADRHFTTHLPMVAGIARTLDLEVVGLGAQAPWPYADDRGDGSSEFRKIVAATKADLAIAAELFRDAFAGEPRVRTRWREAVGYPDNVTPVHARLADLVVAYHDPSGEASVYAAPDNLVMLSGCPVLLTPRTPSAFVGERLLLAWKNTRETRAALAAALPLLQRARRVLLAAVCEDSRVGDVEVELADVSARLARHGVQGVTALVEVGAHGSAGQRLLRMAEVDGSDLIVAGGYGHSRLREWVLGGVTRDLMADGARYLLLNH